MNIVFNIVIIIVALIVLLLIIGLFIKKEYSIEREITINEPQGIVFDYIKLVENQQHYNKWWMRDPNAKKTYIGTDGIIGFIATWDSPDKHAGKGEQEIIKITEGKRVDHEIRFERPFKGIAYSYMETSAVTEGQTKVEWAFYGVNKYPMNLMSKLLNLNKVLGDDLYASLENLKRVLESN